MNDQQIGDGIALETVVCLIIQPVPTRNSMNSWSDYFASVRFRNGQMSTFGNAVKQHLLTCSNWSSIDKLTMWHYDLPFESRLTIGIQLKLKCYSLPLCRPLLFDKVPCLVRLSTDVRSSMYVSETRCPMQYRRHNNTGENTIGLEHGNALLFAINMRLLAEKEEETKTKLGF